jgi:hypothetical protein
MPRYFFDLVASEAPVTDGDGRSFASLADAEQHAIWCAREIIANDVIAGRPIELSSYISVLDEARSEHARIYFKKVISIIDT